MNENAEKIVVASGLTKTFRLGKLDVPALRGVNLVVHQGDATSGKLDVALK